MAWYYGVNNSELYGSNFSTVLADAPPPLDDTYDEDDNEIVFRNDVNKSKKYGEKPVSSPVKRSQSSDEKLKLDGSVPKSGKEHHTEGHEDVEIEEESDFGDFSGFADFGSAFGQGSVESPGWFTSNENSGESSQAWNAKSSHQAKEQDNDDEYADFAAFQENGSIPNGGSDQRNSNSNWSNNGALENKNINGSNDLESDDDFATIDNTTTNPGEISIGNGCKNTRSQPDRSTSQGRTVEGNYESEEFSNTRKRDTIQHNGDLSDKKSVSHLGEPIVNHNSKGSHNDDIDKKDCNSLGESSLSEPKNEFRTEKVTTQIVPSENSSSSSSNYHKDEESRSLGDLSAVATHDEYHSSESSMAVSTEEAKEGDQTNSVSSGNNRKEESENVEQIDEKNNSSITCEQGSIAELSPENVESHNDSFGEFADFDDHSLKQTSIDNNDDEEFVDKETANSTGTPELKVDEGVVGDALQTETSFAEGNNDNGDDDFGDFGSCDAKDESVNDFVAADSKSAEPKVVEGDAIQTEIAPKDDNDNENNDDFGTFEENHDTKDESPIDFVAADSKPKSLSNEDNNDDDFGGFGAFESNDDEPEDNSHGNVGGFNSEDKPLQTEDQSDNDFGDFGTLKSSTINSQKDEDFGCFESNAKDSQKNNSNTDEFGDFGSFEANTKDSPKSNTNTDDFGCSGSFESNAKDLGQDSKSDGFGDFGAFNSQATDSTKKNESDDDFGAFESKKKAAVPNETHGHSEPKAPTKKVHGDNTFRTSDSPASGKIKQNTQSNEFGAFSSNSKNLNTSRQTDDYFGDFSGGSEKKSGGFASVASSTTNSSVSLGASSGTSMDLKQQKAGMLSQFSPSVNIKIKHAGDPISACFTSELRQISNLQCAILSTRVEKSLHSNMGLWQHLEHSEKEGRILFKWSNSFSHHKKVLSLTICQDRPPPLQAGSMLKPMMSLQFSPFGGGPAGSLLMPEPQSKIPQFSSGLSFLEPLKGSQMAAHFTPQDKGTTQLQESTHSEMALPDLSFILGGSLKRAASKSDVKDNVSDTTSESSSLDLDFFAPSTTQPQDGKTESRGLYEEDLLGLNILSSSVEPQKLDSPKPQKTSDTKKVWQHGGVTIPLSSQQNRAQLSATAKSVLDQLEDLAFMNSNVLMFPLKT